MDQDILTDEEEPRPTISRGFLIGLATALGATLLLLSCRILPAYLDQALYQIVLLMTAGAILIEAARRRRLILFDPLILLIGASFAALLALSFFSSDIHKYELSAATLNRLLWIVILWASFLIAVHHPRLRTVLILSAGLGLILMGWRYANTDEKQRLLLSIVGGLVFCLLLWGWRQFTRAATAGEAASKISLNLAAVLAAGAVAAAAMWLAAVQVRLNVGEVDLVRNGRQTEKAVWMVAKQCVQEHPLTGYGGGSIRRKFLQYRPADATLQGVSSRLDDPVSTFAVLAAENGAAGLALTLLILSIPLAGFRSMPETGGDTRAQTGISCLYGTWMVHEILGGGWLLTNAGAMIFFSLAGVCLADRLRKAEWKPPVSFFAAGLIVVGGIFLLQQIYCWTTVQVEKSVKNIRKLLAEKKIDEAVNQVDYNLVFLDARRDDLISILVGGFHGAGMIQQALQNSILLLQRDPDYPSVDNNIATFYMLLRKPQEALPYMIKTAEKHPTTENLSKLAYIHAVTGRKDQAEKHFLEALDLYPREIDLFLARAGRLGDPMTEEAAALEEAAKFSASFFPPGTPRRDWAAQIHRSETQRLKRGLAAIKK